MTKILSTSIPFLLLSIFSPTIHSFSPSTIYTFTPNTITTTTTTTTTSTTTTSTALYATGDAVRMASGKRPSLHPITINAISEALLMRSKAQTNPSKPRIELLQASASDEVTPLDVAMTAGKLATDALDKRQRATLQEMKENGNDENDDTMLFREEECQVIAGRIVGVVTRLQDLESQLVSSVKQVGWVEKYMEFDSFGILPQECKISESNDYSSMLAERIQFDPLFRMNRAECLLALFFVLVEIPKLEILGEEVAGGSQIDFLDQDRLEVLNPPKKEE